MFGIFIFLAICFSQKKQKPTTLSAISFLRKIKKDAASILIAEVETKRILSQETATL